MPTFIMHGDDDQIVPIGASGMCSTLKHEINADLLDFIKKSAKAAA